MKLMSEKRSESLTIEKRYDIYILDTFTLNPENYNSRLSLMSTTLIIQIL